MTAKRKRRVSPPTRGLAPGEPLKRDKTAGNDYSAWGWVGTEVSDASNITQENILATCGFSKRSVLPYCMNSYRSAVTPTPQESSEPASLEGESESEVIVISDDDSQLCSKKLCKRNPNCLNYLGQEVWEDEEEARELFLQASKLGENPILDARDPNLPVGLKNLGATCYANAFLQVWFRDLAFRNGVYQCQSSQDMDNQFEKSPIFQLQVTFAALQESTQNVFNPTKLVESLQLRTTEQQDAQEFSKLFMSHLDAEFQKQSDPSLRSLIADQFQGKQVYGTICENVHCHYRSERVTDFLEIEINFKNDSNLEDRIAALLQPEKLSGDNKYHCPHCQSLQDATRYTELRQLPPVLHFSLLRFIYDFSSMERKKSKHTISFPTSLDMGRFLGAESKNVATQDTEDSHIYELRGVLLHKGASAYHGHYEAQVFDTTNQSWFQFNDETVTTIKALGGKPKNVVIDVVDDDDGRKHSGSQSRVRRTNARKKRRVDDSDDEIIEITSPLSHTPKRPGLNNTSQVSSKDAYMLIYSRKQKADSDHSTPTSQDVPTPPARAMDVINKLNAIHDEACEQFQEREKEVKCAFEDARRKVMDIYRSWSVSSAREESVVVSRQALENWLSVKSIVSAMEQADGTRSSSRSRASESADRAQSESSCAEPNRGPESHTIQKIIDSDHVLCIHGNLNPQKAFDMKRISQAACQMITAETHCMFRPTLTTENICIICVKAIFTERLYQIDHPRLVSQFDQLCEGEQDQSGFWISKKWLKDWRLVKPKMHVILQPDPSPDEPEFNTDVCCEHGGLSLNTTTRRRISDKACGILMGLYPSWNPMRSDAEPCAICEALIHTSKQDKREIRKMAEEEKAKLKHMHESSLSGIAVLENVPCAVLPTQFIRSWRRWLLRPTENARPDRIDNTPFICEHDMLVFDPNDPTDLDASITMIQRSDWDCLESLYSGGPLIGLEKCVTENNIFGIFVHEVPVCADCRRKRKSDYEFTEITVRILGPNDLLTGSEPLSDASFAVNDQKALVMSYGSGKLFGLRQSKRLRQVKKTEERRKLTVSKQTTLKEIKVTIQDELDIPTICQRMFYRGHELEDNAATVASLGILANDILDLREESEEKVSTTSDSELAPEKKRRREEERGFGGTLLGQQLPHAPAQRESSPITLDEKACSACTFRNPPDVPLCDMCHTAFH